MEQINDMKMFARKMGLYMALLLCVLFCFACATILSFVRIQRMSFKIKGDTIVVGHSMLECAIDDSLIPGCLNWSRSGESYFISYYKIRRLLAANPQIEYVICSFSPWGDPEVSKWENDYCFGLGAILPFLNAGDFHDLPIFRVLAWEKALREYWGMHLRHLLKPIPMDYWGKYAKLDRCAVDQDKRYSHKKMLCKNEGFQPSRYIRRVQTLCEEHGATMIMLYTPVFMKEEWFSDVTWIHDEYFPEIEFWDYSTLTLPKDYFADINHLNQRGSPVLTRIIRERLGEMKRRTTERGQGTKTTKDD